MSWFQYREGEAPAEPECKQSPPFIAAPQKRRPPIHVDSRY